MQALLSKIYSSNGKPFATLRGIVSVLPAGALEYKPLPLLGSGV